MDIFSRCQELLKNEKSLAGGGVCSYIRLFGIGTFIEVDRKMGAPCIQALTYAQKPNTKAVIIFSNPKTTDKVYRKYLGYILSEKSPWRDLVLAQPKQDFETVVKYGYILTNLDFPANYVGNFLTAFRLCEEKKDLAELFIRLMDDGVSFGAAAVSCTFPFNYNGKVFMIREGSWHYAFDGMIPAADTVDRINSGTPVKAKLNQLFTQNTDYLPCNVIWGHGRYPITSVFKQVVAENSKKKGTLKRMFSDPVPAGQHEYTYEGLLAFAKGLDDKSIKVG